MINGNSSFLRDTLANFFSSSCLLTYLLTYSHSHFRAHSFLNSIFDHLKPGDTHTQTIGPTHFPSFDQLELVKNPRERRKKLPHPSNPIFLRFTSKPNLKPRRFAGKLAFYGYSSFRGNTTTTITTAPLPHHYHQRNTGDSSPEKST